MKYMSVKEFRELGLLQELNRQFLHPLGLALEVTIALEIDDNADEATKKLISCRIQDFRDDSEGDEGAVFTILDKEKIEKAKEFIEDRHTKRSTKLGFIIQEEDYV